MHLHPLPPGLSKKGSCHGSHSLLFTAAFDLRRHVTLGDKSPEPVSFAVESTLGMIIVPTTGVYPVKVFCTKCTEEEFVIGQVLRCSGIQILYL